GCALQLPTPGAGGVLQAELGCKRRNEVHCQGNGAPSEPMVECECGFPELEEDCVATANIHLPQLALQHITRAKGASLAHPCRWLVFTVVLLAQANDFHLHPRSEEHTSELQSRENLVSRLLLA